MRQLFELFATFFKIGGLTFGGGYAMLPIIQKEVVENKKWAKGTEVLDYYAIGQTTPGTIAINTATFIGYKVKGISGAVAATFGMVAPSLIIITLIASFVFEFEENEYVQSAFGGIRVAVTALVLNTVIKMCKKSVKDVLGWFVFAAAFIAVAYFGISPLWIIGASILLGISIKRKVKNI